MSQRRRKVTTYGEALADKQKIKYHYGMREAQLRRYFSKARSQKGDTGEILLVMCERRLDNVIRRAGFTLTRMQARQGVVHRHFQLNGKTINKPSIFVQPGDVITLRNRPNLRKYYREVVDSSSRQSVDWISFDAKDLEARVQTLPVFTDATVPDVQIGRVIAFLSR